MGKYLYDPKDYAYSPGLLAEMEDFYTLLEKFQADKSHTNWSFLDKQRRDLFFSIKHRIVEGFITKVKAQEMQDYFGELFDEEPEPPKD
jgi:outer membrane receptor for ferric coprogen and ferric-rhodotorulic acid